MKPSVFQYHSPSTLDEAVALLAQFAEEDGRILAGGQSLVPMMNLRLAAPAHLIDINGVAGLDRMREENGMLVIPACVRHADFERPAAKGVLGRLLAEVVRHIGHSSIRTRGTFCGSLAHADPASEWCLAAATLDARMRAVSVRGEREIRAADFFGGVMTTVLKPDECLAEVRLPLLEDDCRFGFFEVSRRAGDFAMAAALVLWRDNAGRISQPRIGIGAVEPSPRRVREAEAALEGQAPSADGFVAAADAAVAALREVMTDARMNGAFRRDLARTAIIRACERSAR
jgi:carbon-monoxide dehydrogenase medium subunit